MRLSAAGLVFVVLMGSLSGCLSADSNAKSGIGPYSQILVKVAIRHHMVSFRQRDSRGIRDMVGEHVIAHLYGWNLLWNRYDNI